MIDAGGIGIAARLRQSLLNPFAPPCQSFQRSRCLVCAAQRDPQALIGLGKLGAAAGERIAGSLFAGLGLLLVGAGGIDLRLDGGAVRGDRLQPVEPDQSFRRRSPAFHRHIAVPAAQLAIAGDEALADGKGLAFIPVGDRNLGQTAGEFGRGVDMGGEWRAAVGQCGVACQRRRAGPAALAVGGDRRFQIVAQRSGQSAFIARRGLEPIERTGTTAGTAIYRAFERSRFAVERGECGARGGECAFGRGTLLTCRLTRAFGGMDRGFGGIAGGAGLFLRSDGGGALCFQRCGVGQGGGFAAQALNVAFRALQPVARGHQRRFGDAQFGLFACLLCHRLGQIQFGVAGAVLGAGDAACEIGAQLFGFGDARLQRCDFGGEARDGVGGVIGERAFARAILLQPGGLLGQIMQPPDHAVALGA